MKILVLAEKKIQKEFQQKFKATHEYIFEENYQFDAALLEEVDMVFDFFIDESPENFDVYKDLENLIVFCNSPKLSLAELSFFHDDIECTVFGFNGLPSMLERSKLEVTLLQEKDKTALQEICKALETDYWLVQDRVGMVTPRITAMMINEAYYTIQEGLTSKEELKNTEAPAYANAFAALDKIGLRHIYELLEALYEDTKDDRFRICPLLKREYLMA